MSVCEKKIRRSTALIHAEQMSLYNFIVLRKKTIDTAQDRTTETRHFKSMGIYGFFSTVMQGSRGLFVAFIWVRYTQRYSQKIQNYYN